MFLNAIPDIYKEVKNVIKYERKTLTPDIVVESLKCKEREMKYERIERRGGEIHLVRGRPQTRSGERQNKSGKKNGRSRSKSQGKEKGRKCYGCEKLGHFIKDYYIEKNK